MTIRAGDLRWRAGGKEILRGISLDIVPGEFLGLVGPNGSGKTSLMALLSGLRRPRDGTVTLDGRDLSAIDRRTLARRIAFVEQQAETSERITARQAVELGRTPHLGALAPWSTADDAAVREALAAVEMTERAAQLWHTLSGGERQRLHIARALAQTPEFLFLDEPTNHLDIHHQMGLLELVRGRGVTVVAALHDLNHAAMFCDRVAVLHDGLLVGLGTPAAVLTPHSIRSVFGVSARVEIEPDGVPLIRFRRPEPHRPTLQKAIT